MLGFSVLHRDASGIELLHARSGTTFTFALSDGKLTDKFTAATDSSGNYPCSINVEDHTAIEKLAAVARIAAGLHLPTEPPKVAAHLSPPGDTTSTDT
jgi:hypothetical protein